MKGFFFFIFLILFGAGMIYGLGANEEVEYENSVKDFFPERRFIIWEGLTDIERIPNIKRDVEQIVILENDRGLYKWEEKLGTFKGKRTFRTLEKTEPYRYKIELLESSWGISGVWTFTLTSGQDGGTFIEIKEESKTQNTWLRGINKIRGRDVYLNRYVKEIKVMLFRNLIDTN